MSTIKFASNASGSGSVTIASPNTNSDVTLSLPNDNGTLLYANSSGNVGIGTSSPSTYGKFAVKSTPITNFTGTSTSGIGVVGYSSVGDWNGITFAGDSGTLFGRIAAQYTASGSYLSFGTSNNYSSGITNQAVTIDPSGNVGIGKTNPQASLDYRETVNVINTNTTAVASRTYVLTASLTLTLPSTPTAGDWVTVQNSSGTTTAVIARNGSNIMSLAENLTLDADFVSVTLVYADATRGWVFG